MGKRNKEKFVQVWLTRKLRKRIESLKHIIERKKKEGYRASCWEVIEYFIDSGIHEQVVVPLNVTTLYPLAKTAVLSPITTKTINTKIKQSTVNIKLKTTVNHT